MKFRKMEFVFCEDVAEEVSYIQSPAKAANRSQFCEADLSVEDKALLDFLSGDEFSFEAMQSRWQ